MLDLTCFAVVLLVKTWLSATLRRGYTLEIVYILILHTTDGLKTCGHVVKLPIPLHAPNQTNRINKLSKTIQFRIVKRMSPYNVFIK